MNRSVERIVVALDAISENRVAIGAATRMAERWKIRLHGVFVEDDDLIRLAGLPFARQVSLGIGVESLTLQRAERQMRAFAKRARHDLAASAKRHGIEWSFEIVRGGGMVATSGDFLVAGTTTRPIGGHFRVECRWWSVGEPGPATYLLAHRIGDPHSAVAVLLHGRDADSERLLTAAARVAEANDARLVVMCDPEIAEMPGLRAWLAGSLADYAPQVELEPIPSEPARLYRRIAEMHCQLVALAASAEAARPDRLRDLVAQIACDVLVVR